MGSETAYGKFLSSSQTMGFLVVVAVSGSLAFLTFGRFRLWQSGSDQGASNEIQDKMQENAQQIIDDSSRVAKQNSLASPSGKRSVVMKKVRFALDVVEPAGNSQEYRCRTKEALKASNKAYSEEQEQEILCEKRSTERKPLIRSQTLTSCKQHLPANRMLLYNGMQRYKAMTALHCNTG